MTPDHRDFDSLPRKKRAAIYHRLGWHPMNIAEELEVSVATVTAWLAIQRKFYTHSIPEDVHPLVKRLFVALNAKRMSVPALSETTGVPTKTINNWRIGDTPGVDKLEACFRALNLELVAIPGRIDQHPPKPTRYRPTDAQRAVAAAFEDRNTLCV